MLLERAGALYPIQCDERGAFRTGPLEVADGADVPATLTWIEPVGYALLGAPITVHLRGDQELDLDLRAQRTLAIRGLVLDAATGQPLPGIQLRLLVSPHCGDWEVASAAAQAAACVRLGHTATGVQSVLPQPSEHHARRSDARGRFEFEAVAAVGTAQLVSTSPDYFVNCMPLRLGAPSPSPHGTPGPADAPAPGEPQDPPRQPDATPLDSRRAEPAPGWGTDLRDPGLELRIELVARPRVRGRLTDARGEPLAHHAVTVECSENYLPGDDAPIGWAALAPGARGEPGPALQVLGRRHEATQRVQVRQHARTDAGGMLDVALPQHGEIRLFAFAGRMGFWIEEFTLREGDGDRDLGPRALRAPRPGHVTLQTPGGRVLADLRLAVTCDDAFQTQLPGPERDGCFRTDGAGRLPLCALPQGLALRLWPRLPGACAPLALSVATDHLRDGETLVLQVPDDR